METGNEKTVVKGTMILRGNNLVKVNHVWVPGDGCYFETKEIAIKQGCSPNGTGFWCKQIEFNGTTWFQAGNTNQFD